MKVTISNPSVEQLALIPIGAEYKIKHRYEGVVKDKNTEGVAICLTDTFFDSWIIENILSITYESPDKELVDWVEESDQDFIELMDLVLIHYRELYLYEDGFFKWTKNGWE